MLRFLLAPLAALILCGPALADRSGYLSLARKGWLYELRTTMLGRDLSIPVHINGRDLSGASLCLVGDRPAPGTQAVIDSFRGLVHHVFGKPLPMRYAGPSARNCGSGRMVVLRLYSGAPPNRALSDDIDRMNEVYDFGLPAGRFYAATSPAMAQTFFGRRGKGTHIMVKQPGPRPPGEMEQTFYRSILVEELFQAFTFGMDIVQFDRSAPFTSKLQEVPMDLRHFSWESEPFMKFMLRANPPGLCEFDVFMMHAVASAPVDETNTEDFIAYIDAAFDGLVAQARETMQDPAYAPLMAPDCAAVKG